MNPGERFASRRATPDIHYARIIFDGFLQMAESERPLKKFKQELEERIWEGAMQEEVAAEESDEDPYW